jgi:hypothetical protein
MGFKGEISNGTSIADPRVLRRGAPQRQQHLSSITFDPLAYSKGYPSGDGVERSIGTLDLVIDSSAPVT